MFIIATFVSTTPSVSEQCWIQSATGLAKDQAPGNRIGEASCNGAVTWGGNFVNPWNSYPDATEPVVTPCPAPASPPASSVTCYHAADPDACPEQSEPGWCFCNDYAALYPIMTGEDPCGYTVLPTTTTTSPVCTATE